VKELSTQLALKWEEADLREDDLQNAQELLLTSTPFGIAPVGNLDGRKLPINGPIFTKLWSAWQQLIAEQAA
jgi:branched-subunit amino acid aminotransferase/4-amino-4-deoxychorismate lyase